MTTAVILDVTSKAVRLGNAYFHVLHPHVIFPGTVTPAVHVILAAILALLSVIPAPTAVELELVVEEISVIFQNAKERCASLSLVLFM